MCIEIDKILAENDCFKIDPEFHLMGDVTPYSYFPGVQMWHKAVDNAFRPFLTGMPPDFHENLPRWAMERTNDDPERILEIMDYCGLDIACLLPESCMDTTGYVGRYCTNSVMGRIVESNPDRFLYHPNMSPIKHRGVKHAIWELEYWEKEKGAKIFKYLCTEDTYINDPELWPFYEKAQELDIVLCIHTGMSWCPPQASKYAHPMLLDDVCRDFPALRVIAFHMGYPYCDQLNVLAMGHPNLYLCLSVLVPWAINSPRNFARILGEALRWVGPDRIIWGTDTPGLGAATIWGAYGLCEFQMPEDMREGYGYPEITDEDRRKIFGENLGRLLGIDTSRRRVKK